MRNVLRVVLVCVFLVVATPAGAITAPSGWTVAEDLLQDLVFLDAHHGIGISNYRGVQFTTDGGDTWIYKSLSAYLGEYESLSTVCWSDTTHLWALGSLATLVMSDDAGATWQDVTPSSWSGRQGVTIAFADNLHGWAALELGTVQYRTVDGGATWSACSIPSAGLGPMEISAMAFSGGSVGVAVGWDGRFAWTSDGGASWIEATSPTSEPYYGVDFRTPTDVWAVGWNGSVVRSGDAGRSWIVVPPVTAATLTDIEWVGTETGLIGGDWATLIQSDDGGNTWHLRSFGEGLEEPPVTLASSDTTAWACGPQWATLNNPSPSPVSVAPVEFAVAGGYDRAQSSVRLSQSEFLPGEPEAVVVAGYSAWPDAMCAAPLAAAYDGPVLLAPPYYGPDSGEEHGLHAEIDRLQPEEIIILGGTAAVADWIEDHLRTQHPGTTVRRVAGHDRYQTSALVAQEIVAKRSEDELPLSDTVYLTTGDAPADALAVGSLAATEGSPILLTQRDVLPPAVHDALADYKPEETALLGGTARISSALQAQIDTYSWTETIRIGGFDRFETAACIARHAVDAHGLVWDRVAVCRGDLPWDALAAGPVQARRNAPLLLLELEALGDNAADTLAAHTEDINLVQVAGGWAAVSYDRLDEIEALFE